MLGISSEGFFFFKIGQEIVAEIEGLNEQVFEAELLGVVQNSLIFRCG